MSTPYLSSATALQKNNVVNRQEAASARTSNAEWCACLLLHGISVFIYLTGLCCRDSLLSHLACYGRPDYHIRYKTSVSDETGVTGEVDLTMVPARRSVSAQQHITLVYHPKHHIHQFRQSAVMQKLSSVQQVSSQFAQRTL